MSNQLPNIGTTGKGIYQFKVVEKEICLRVARKAVKTAGYAAVFEQTSGRRFSGTGADRALLPPEIGRRVDSALRKSMRRYPGAWRKSPVGRVVIDRPKADNLILNQGLDYLAGNTTSWGTLGNYCVLGTGTATPAFTDTGLGTEIIRTNTTLSTGTDTTDDVGARTRTLRRTYDFPVEGSSSFPVGERSGHNYSELGLSHTATVTNNLSTRALITGGTVTAIVGQQARVEYSIVVTLGPNVVSTFASTTGWTAGLQGTSAFCTFGGTPNRGNAGVSTNTRLALATSSTIPAFGTRFSSGTPSNSSAGGLNTYTTGSYKRTRWCSWGPAEGVGTWRSLFITTGSAETSEAWCWVFDNAQTKDDRHTLTIVWSMSYGRT